MLRLILPVFCAAVVGREEPVRMSPAQAVEAALARHSAGDGVEAERILRMVTEAAPTHPGALFSLGAVIHAAGRLDEAVSVYERSIEVNPDEQRHNLAFAHRQLGQHDQALRRYKEILERSPTDLPALNGVGLAYHYLTQYEEAVEWYDRAIDHNPDFAEGHYNKGVSLASAGKIVGASTAYYAALHLEPGYSEARLNLASLFHGNGQTDEAIYHYERAIAVPEEVAWGGGAGGTGPGAGAAGGAGGARSADPTNAALEPVTSDLRVMALSNIGVAHQMERRGQLAVEVYQEALRVLRSPEHLTYVMGAGKASADPGSHRTPDDVLDTRAHNEIDLLSHINRARRSVCDWTAYDYELVRILRLVDRRQLARGKETSLLPFDTLLLPVPPSWQLQVARSHSGKWATPRFLEHGGGVWRSEAEARAGESGPRGRQGRRRRRRRSSLHVGFVSYDFNDHPTAHMIEGLFVNHVAASEQMAAVALGRTGGQNGGGRGGDGRGGGGVGDRFSVYNYGKNDESVFRVRIEKESQGRFVELASTPHLAAARRIYEDAPDIVIDLQGHTLGGRAEILAYRPAPIQAIFLIYPGTTGSHWHDYQISDRHVVPADIGANHYSEKLVMMRDTYQVNFYPPFDLPPRIVRAPPAAGEGRAGGAMSDEWERWANERAVHGLPRQGFVFCNFNKADKLDPPTFDAWMSVLRRTPGSVIWLLAPSPPNSKAKANAMQESEVQDNLRREARMRGVDPKRLVFAARIPKRAHLERHRFVGLVLDSFVYGAHSTGMCVIQWCV